VSAAAKLTARTRLFALLGDPVSHSFSPQIHNAVFTAEKIDAVYLALRCTAQDCERLLLGLARAGGGGNVTVPHKELVARLVDRPSSAVLRTGACNTYWLENGEVCGENTDAIGFREAMLHFTGPAAGARVALIGAGGSARAVVAALTDEKADRIEVIARTASRIEGLQAIAENTGTTVTAAHLPLAGAYDLVVNATPLGIHEGDAFPVPIEQLRNCRGVMDLVYGRNGTPWIKAALAAGIPAIDGSEMLLYQGVASFERWFGRPAPIEVMRQALTR
jgi:shikimate dehydrogenase